MSINVNTNGDDGFRDIVILLLNSLRSNVEFKPIINDHNKIDSFKNYIFSRYIEKLTSISANYIRIDWLITKMDFKEIESLISDDKEKLKDESQIELITTILRPLTEIYIEVKSIELSKNKFNMDIDASCRLLYFDSITESYQLKRTISNEIYDCDPKYFKLWCETALKEVNKIKQELSNKDVLLLKNVKNKYKSILENYGTTERMVLGFDYLSHYAVISKKAHFSYTNVPFSNFKPSVYHSWCLLYILLIYEHIMRLLEKNDEVFEKIKPLIKHFTDKSSTSTNNLYQIGDYVFLEFGIAIIKKIKDMTYEVEYEISNCFKTKETDFIPKIFLIGKIDKSLLEITKRKYYDTDLDIYQDEKFDLFYRDIYKQVAPKPIEIK